MKKGIYVINFDETCKNTYRISYTSNLNRSLRELKKSHGNNLNLIRFYEMDNNIQKACELFHWRLKSFITGNNFNDFKIINLNKIDLIANEIIPIMNNNQYPQKDIDDSEIRLFIIKILGGNGEDIGYDRTDEHERFDFGGRNKNSILHNNSIIKKLHNWKLLSNALDFEFAAAEGNATWWFSLKRNYIIKEKLSYMVSYLDNSYIDYYYYFIKGYFQYEDDYTKNFILNISNKEHHFAYSCDASSLGTITIITDIIKTITLSDYSYS